MSGLTEAQREFLNWLPQDETKWRMVGIDRSGRSKGLSKVRQQCADKGLAIMSDQTRRAWRITSAGRAAIASPTEGTKP